MFLALMREELVFSPAACVPMSPNLFFREPAESLQVQEQKVGSVPRLRLSLDGVKSWRALRNPSV